MRIKEPSFLDRSYMAAGARARLLRQVLSYLGPGFFVTVGFIDPGNWAVNIAAGSEFGYHLLWVVGLGTGVLILWQHMSAHLGIIKGKCLPEAIHDNVKPSLTAVYGLTAMAASVATALAEILGAALGFNMLFGFPVWLGTVISAALVIWIIWFQKYLALERLIVGFVTAIGFCYLIELYLVKPDWASAAIHVVKPELSSRSIMFAMAILGAVVMPHNLYLHSEVIQNRRWKGKSEPETRRLLRFEFVDTLVAMLVGMAINAAMIIVAAAVFNRHGVRVTELSQASASLEPLAAKISGNMAGMLATGVFGLALLFSGIASSVTAGVAAGTIFSGYLGKRTDLESGWFRAGMVFTLLAAATIIMFVSDTFRALTLSQVCLSLQLPFTMLPLFLLTSSRRVMGNYVNGRRESLAMVVTGALVIILNILLVYSVFGGKFGQ